MTENPDHRNPRKKKESETPTLTVVLDGWVFAGDKKNGISPEKLKTFLDPHDFRYTYMEVPILNLVVTKIERWVGSIFNPGRVQGVVDLEGSSMPFFIDQRKISKLKRLIARERAKVDVKAFNREYI